jgi:hypothetical protein
VRAAETKEVGRAVTFYLTIWNPGDEPLDEVVIESDFDEPLVFPGRAEKRVTQSVGRLGPRESREMALTLVGERPGRHCARFTVTIEGREAVWKSVCVEFVASAT